MAEGASDGSVMENIAADQKSVPKAACYLTKVVVIGRNEGSRLSACLQSIDMALTPVIYVDSGSTDRSVEVARNAGALVVELDPAQPFTAARARNEGFKKALEDDGAAFIQFVDGDCTLDPNWIDGAVSFLNSRSNVALVCGRLRERFPEHSIYNRLCDFEWDTPIGEVAECGGIFLIRSAVFRNMGGFSSLMVAGEEPELCARLLASGWKVWKIDEEMGNHDANILEFGQWWRRMVRNGYAFAEGARMHPDARSSVWTKKLRRAVLWGGAIPMVIVTASLVYPPAILAALIYLAQILRIAARHRDSGPLSLPYAVFTLIGKFAEFFGAVRYHVSIGRQK